MKLNITCIPGDGIGPEIVAQAKKVLDQFEEYLPKFKKIIPADYKQLLHLISQYEEQGMSREKAQIEAFYASTASGIE